MHSSSYLSPQCTTETGMKQCWPQKQALTALSVGCLSAKNTCVTEHVSVFQMSQFYSTKLCVQEVDILSNQLRGMFDALLKKGHYRSNSSKPSLQATPVRITNRFEIDVKIKNSSFLYINHFGPKNQTPSDPITREIQYKHNKN